MYSQPHHHPIKPKVIMLRYMLLAAFVLGTMAQDSSQECEEVSMTVKGGLCDGMKAPEKVCGGKEAAREVGILRGRGRLLGWSEA